eukprot:2413644-Prymnesium_polylepis.1
MRARHGCCGWPASIVCLLLCGLRGLCIASRQRPRRTRRADRRAVARCVSCHSGAHVLHRGICDICMRAPDKTFSRPPPPRAVAAARV